MSEQSPELLPHHLKLLQDAGICEEVILARGYRSPTTKTEVKGLGFTERQALVPCLLIPLLGPGGETVARQIRPDQPRSQLGKLQTIEMPISPVIHLDVPPPVRGQLEAETPLLVTTSVFAADALASQGMCAISLHGGSLSSGQHIGTPLVLNTKGIRLERRAVILDSAFLPHHIEALGRHVVSHNASVRVLTVEVESLISAEHQISSLVDVSDPWSPSPDEGLENSSNGALYEVRDGCIVWCRSRTTGLRDLPLANFTATIREEIIADDGQEERGELLIAGTLENGRPLPEIRVPLNRFESLQWVTMLWGARAIITAGQGARDHLRAAIQRLSPRWTRRREYTHPGWRQLKGRWCFLTQEIVIGPDGPVANVIVRLDGSASRIRLGAPPTGEELRNAIRATLRILDLAPDRITIPLLGGVFRAVLNPAGHADMVLFLIGPTGVWKSEMAALIQRFYGEGFDRNHLPAAWSATANALERIAFDFKDCLLVIDDFAPSGSVQDVRRYHQTADRMIRTAGNSAGRDRMQADGSLRAALPPRGLILGTGEDVPRGQSIRARMVILEVDRTSIDREGMKWFQAAGRTLPSQMQASYVQWVAARFDTIRQEFGPAAIQLRDDLQTSGVHARTPDALAGLAAAWSLWLRFAMDAGAVTVAERDLLWLRVMDAMRIVAAAQGHHLAQENPVEHFLDLLRAAMSAGAAHVTSPDDRPPGSRPSPWGWHRQEARNLISSDTWISRGERIGWLEGGDLYLDPTATYRALQHYASSSGATLAVTQATLWKRLREAGLLRTTDANQQTHTIRKSVGGVRRRVLHFAATTIVEMHDDDTSQSPRTQPGQNGQVGQVFDTGGTDSGDARTRGPGSTRRLWNDDNEETAIHEA